MTAKALVRDADGASTTAPLVDHLRELRRRIVISLLAVAAGAATTFALADGLITLLRSPLGAVNLYFTGVGCEVSSDGVSGEVRRGRAARTRLVLERP